MITQINARTPGGQLLSLPLEDVSNGYIVSEVEGLGPVKATIVTAKQSAVDGVFYQSASRDLREIKIKVELEPDFIVNTVQTLRDRLYTIFMPKSPVLLEFLDSDGRVATISGRVETVEPVIFTATPTIEINVLCFKPDFIDGATTIINGSTVTTTQNVSVNYLGTSSSGFKFTIKPARSLTDLTLVHTAPDGTESYMEFNYPLAANDTLTITTTPREKAVTKLSGGVLTSVLYGLSPLSPFPQLQPGQNYIRVVTAGATVPYTVEYAAKYGGL